MDTLDKLILLRQILSTIRPADKQTQDCSNKINEWIDIIQKINRRNTIGYDITTFRRREDVIMKLTPDQETSLGDFIIDSIELIPADQKSIMDPSKWNTLVPPSLQISGVTGILECGPGGWSFPPCRNFQVRGSNYLKDNEKVANVEKCRS